MPRRLLFSCMLSTLLVFTGGNVAAEEIQAADVRDLQYGDVLFHFYKGDYFTAITRLMAAQERNDLPHHAQDAEMLLGGLELSYGMPIASKKHFLRTLQTSADREQRSRAWYYLGKIAFERGHYARARDILLKFEPVSDETLMARHALLLANTEMHLDDNQAAAKLLDDSAAPADMAAYLRINRGIALLRLGWVEAGREELELLGLTETNDPELRALRDRANLNLGYELLRAEHFDKARTFLNRVRLHGPYARAALLGAGWVDAAEGDFDSALTPWLELLGRSHYDSAVQEAHLAVPFAFEQLNDTARAIHYYNAAIDYYDREQAALDYAVRSVRDGLLDTIIAQLPRDDTGGWLQDNMDLDGLPGTPYITDVLAGNAFQEQLKNYRDLVFLDRHLERRLHDIDLLHDMVETRRQADAQRSPLVRKRLEQNEAEALAARLQVYRNKIASQERHYDPLGLATTEERRQWDKLESIQAGLTVLDADDPQVQKLTEKARWLKGVLYWRVQDDYPQRLWDIKKLLKTAAGSIEAAQTRQAGIASKQENIDAGFAGYDERIARLQARIELLRPQVKQALERTGEALKSIALEGLRRRDQRLVSYRNQAHYALARLYDDLARQQREQREEAGQ